MLRLAVLLGVLLAGACATRSSEPGGVASWPADEAAIRAALRESADAWNRADLRGHLAIYADSVTMMTGNGPMIGVPAIEQAFTRTFWSDGRPNQNLQFEQVTLRPLGSGVALQTGRFILTGGGLPEQAGWFTLVWVRTPEGWRAVHDHTG